MFTTGLVIGGIIGAAVGVLITSLCVASKGEFDAGQHVMIKNDND